MPIADGFDPKWRSVPHYILGITQEIWEQREISTLHRYYGKDLVVRSPASVVQGNSGIIAATQSTLAEFSDRELPGEDVIWCWADPSHEAFLSSHRLLCWATHNGTGLYGAPTGRRLTYRILADCFCAKNEVRDEWLVRDQGAIVRQMGEDLLTWTRALIAREGGPEACVAPFTPAIDIPGPYAGCGAAGQIGSALEAYVLAGLAGEAGRLADLADPAAELNYPGHVTRHGHAAGGDFWMSLRASFPSAETHVHHVVGRHDPGMSPRAAVRWSLTGRHDGHGIFGAPTGAPVHVMGITHAEFGPRGLRREWTLYDETAVLKQILLHTGDL